MTARLVSSSSGASEATTSALGTVKVRTLPRTSESAMVEIERRAADRWVPRQTVQTNFAAESTKSVTGVAGTGIFTSAAHAYAPGDVVTFVLTSGGSGLTAGLPYYILATNYAANTFSVGTQAGGSVVTFATDLTTGTVARRPGGPLFDFIDKATGATTCNMIYTTSSSRPALRAADGGSGTWATFTTKENRYKNWELRIRYRPANDTTTASTDYGPDVIAGWSSLANCYGATQYHAAGNPRMSPRVVTAGAQISLPDVLLPASPLSTSQDRMLRIRKEGDRFCLKEWALNTVEPGWQREQRVRTPYGGPGPNSTTDNPEYGVAGLRSQYCGAYILDFTLTELVRESENLIHNADFTRIDTAIQTDGPKNVTGVASTGVFTTTSAHSYSVGDLVVFSGIAGLSAGGHGNLVPLRDYYVAATPLSTTFTVSDTRGGAAITFTGDITNAGAFVTRNPSPSGWYRTGTPLSGNYLEVRHMAGPDGSIRPALVSVAAVINDSNLIWTQDIWNPLNCHGAGSFATRLNPHPQSIPARRLEFSAWVKGAVTAISAPALGVTLDVYIYDDKGNLMMDRQTYHPGLSPTTANDGGVDVASYDGAQSVSTFGWTHLRSVIEISQVEAVNRMRCQVLWHESADTGYVYIMDPCLRPIG